MIEGVAVLDAITLIICSLIAVGAALYVCFGRVAIRAVISLFMCLFSVSWVLVVLGHEFLGFLCLFVAVSSAGAFLLYSSSIIGNIQEERLESSGSPRVILSRITGLLVGLGGGWLAATLLLSNGTITEGTVKAAGSAGAGIGGALMGDHAVTFILSSCACLGLMMGVGILVREARR